MTTEAIITPILTGIYGSGRMVSALIEDLAPRIDNFELQDEAYMGDAAKQRERMIMLRCWDFFSGGGTAQIAAERIEEALAKYA